MKALFSCFDPKKGGGVNLTHPPPMFFFKNIFYRKRVKPCFLVNFNITINYIFPETFAEIYQVVQKIYLYYCILVLTQQKFQRCFNVVFWLIQRRDVEQRQINVETTLCISALEFTTWNNVQSTLCISTLIWTTLDNIETTFSFSTSSFTTLVNVETTLWKWPFLNNKTNHFK